MFYLNYVWRLLATAFSFLLFGLVGLLMPWVTGPWIHLRYSNRTERRLRARHALHRLFRVFIRIWRFLGVIDWEIHHIERLERPGLLVLANHPSLFDVVFLMAFIPVPDCIVKERLFGNPVMRGFLRLTGFLANSNPVGLIEDARASLGAGSSLVIFPEGTRTDPNGTLHFQRGAANIALRTQTPVTPVVIVCEPLTLTKKHRWYHIPASKPKVTLRVGEDLPLTPYQHQPVAQGVRTLTRYLQDYFTEELSRHEHNSPRQAGAGIEAVDYHHPRP